MQKKLLIIPLLVAMICLLGGCGDKTTSNSNGTSKTNGEEEVSSKAQIDEKVIVDNDSIKITAKSLEYDSTGVKINLSVENNFAHDIIIQINDFSINDIMINSKISGTATAVSKTNLTININNTDLQDVKISTIKNIEFGLTIFNKDNHENIFDESGIVLTTDDKKYTQEYNADGVLAVDQDGIKIYLLKQTDTESFAGSKIIVYTENNTNEPITMQATDVYTNGLNVNYTFSTAIMPGKKSYSELSYSETSLTDNGITDITSIDLTFMIFNSNTWDSILKTDTINVKF